MFVFIAGADAFQIPASEFHPLMPQLASAFAGLPLFSSRLGEEDVADHPRILFLMCRLLRRISN